MKIGSTSMAPRKAALAAFIGTCLWAGLPAAADAEVADAWREFARRSMMPDYSWNDAPSASSLAPTLRDTVFGKRGNTVSYALSARDGEVRRTLNLAVESVSGSGADVSHVRSAQSADFTSRLSPLRSRFLDTSYEQRLQGGASVSVSALIVQQQFATPGLGLLAGVYDPALFAANNIYGTPYETVTGQGVRVDYRMPLSEQFTWHWTAQTRLAMNTFESVYGMYAEPGNFDLPARIGLQTEWHARPNLAFSVGAERVYFSDVKPFTSVSMPARLLSLMASGQSPAFEWQDLTVYSLEGRYADRWNGQWSLRYATQQQPSPSAELYRRALQSEYTNTNISLGYQRGVGLGELAFAASYAPSMAFLGPGPAFASRTYERGANAEFEAYWVVPF